MIHLVLDEVNTKAKVVGAPGPIEVRHVSVDAIVADDGAPVVLVAEAGVAGDVEDGEAALADIGTVGAGNLEDFEANVLAIVGPDGVMVHQGATEVGVEQDGGRDDIADAAAKNVGLVIAIADAGRARRAARVAAEGLAQRHAAEHRGNHHAVFAEHVGFGARNLLWVN